MVSEKLVDHGAVQLFDWNDVQGGPPPVQTLIFDHPRIRALLPYVSVTGNKSVLFYPHPPLCQRAESFCIIVR